MPMATDKNKAKQLSVERAGPQEHTPPRLRTGERSFDFQLTSRCERYRSIVPSILYTRATFFRG